MLRMTDERWDELKWFSAHEFSKPAEMSETLMYRLDHARTIARVPFRITSDVREDSDNHKTGRAVDIACVVSSDRYRILRALLIAGFQRIGVYDKHIHVDVNERRGLELIWVGESR